MARTLPRHWDFYGRTAELSEIRRILSANRWFFCAISGRRRIGKTALVRRALEKARRRHLYVQIPDGDEWSVVQVFRDAIIDFYDENADGRAIADAVKTLGDVADVIETLNHNRIIVIIDEFQYFHRESLSVFTSLLQAKVDRLRDTATGGIFVLGSIHTEMMAILEDRVAPLFNRVTHRLTIRHWDFETLFAMFDAQRVRGAEERLFLWTLFEGVPKFYRDCFEQGLFGLRSGLRTETLRRLFLEGSSPLSEEAASWFLRELRGRHDSILKAIARHGPCSYAQLKAEFSPNGASTEAQFGGYLQTLIERFGMVEKLLPIFSGDASRKARYAITDNFLLAWLTAIDRNVKYARVRPAASAAKRASEQLQPVEGLGFEKMVRLLTEECSKKEVGDFPLTDVVRGYWNKPDGSDIEIDLVAVNAEAQTVRFGSCKRSATKHTSGTLASFEQHIARFLQTAEGGRLSGWNIDRVLYSPEFTGRQRKAHEDKGYGCLDLHDFSAQLARRKSRSIKRQHRR